MTTIHQTAAARLGLAGLAIVLGLGSSLLWRRRQGRRRAAR